MSGRLAEAQQVLDQLKGRTTRPNASPIGIAIIYAGLGDNDRSLLWLEKAYEERSGGLVHLKVDPVFDSLRSDFRFQDLLRRINLS